MTGQIYDRINIGQEKLMTVKNYDRTSLWQDTLITGKTYDGKNIEQEKVKQRSMEQEKRRSEKTTQMGPVKKYTEEEKRLV